MVECWARVFDSPEKIRGLSLRQGIFALITVHVMSRPTTWSSRETCERRLAETAGVSRVLALESVSQGLDLLEKDAVLGRAALTP